MASGYLTNLAEVARRTGYPVKTVKGWKTRGDGGFDSVEIVACHHTAGPSTGNMPSLGVVTYGRPGLRNALCNYGLGRDGTIYVVAAGVAWHAGVVRSWRYRNDRAVGIEAEEDGVSGWAQVQLDAYAALCNEVRKQFGRGVGRVLGHKEICSPPGRKIDPNFNMDRFRTRVRDSSSGGDDWIMATKDDWDKLRRIVQQEVQWIDERVWKADVIPAEPPSKDNPTWQAGNVLNLLVRQNGAIRQQNEGIMKAVQAMASDLPADTRQAVQEALAEATVQVDVNVQGGDQ